jgi:hypothetical protein
VISGDDSGCLADASTMNRWKSDWREGKEDIEQRLDSEYTKESGTYTPLISRVTMLSIITKTMTRWLAYVMKLLINAGHKLRTRFAFCPAPICDRLFSVGTNIRNGGNKNDKTNAIAGESGIGKIQNHRAIG